MKRKKSSLLLLVWDEDQFFASLDRLVVFLWQFVQFGPRYIHDASWKCTSSDAHSSTPTWENIMWSCRPVAKPKLISILPPMQTIFKGLLLIMAISRFINSYYFDFVAYKVEQNPDVSRNVAGQFSWCTWHVICRASNAKKTCWRAETVIFRTPLNKESTPESFHLFDGFAVVDHTLDGSNLKKTSNIHSTSRN